ncbi:hypothetical protein [Simkania negevensis]|uniref:Uncharacterized protein n=1 Tax=Simkania negevensis (strain ATCC VR-1471 / DSM 27360 / Z) TaxID=331113 RepID=F8L6T9_SIMNZ|nr:hypothetical protein [Simkania negevensis]CCB88437.1 unknown protein [Simkania negevensis Z]
MHIVLVCIFFPLSLFATLHFNSNELLQDGDYKSLYEHASTSLELEAVPERKIEALFNRTLSQIFLDDFDGAFQDLSGIEEIASQVPVSTFTSSSFRQVFTEYAWFRLGMAAAQKNKQDMFRCLEVLKIIDDSFPTIMTEDHTIQIIPKCQFQKISSFVDMLLGLNVISNRDQVTCENQTIRISYPDSFFALKPSHYLNKIEIAAARSFCLSHWADVSWEFIGKCLNSSCIWTYFSFGDWHYELLKKIEKSGG